MRRRATASATVFGVVLFLALALNFVDVQEVLADYLAHWKGADFCPREKDWSVFFLVTKIGVLRNLLFVVFAYFELNDKHNAVREKNGINSLTHSGD